MRRSTNPEPNGRTGGPLSDDVNPRTFLKEFEQSPERDRLVELVYDEMLAYCRKKEITENAVSTETVEQLAEGFVIRGFGDNEWRKMNSSAEELFSVDEGANR